MDFKKIYEGGEPKISNPDLMFMQYSNYYGLQNLSKIFDKNGLGVIISGCELTSDYNSVDDQCIISVSDGYLIANDELIHARSVTPITVDIITSNPSWTFYIYATPLVSYNVLGTKTFNDNNVRETWEQTSIELSFGTSHVAPAGAIVLSKILISNIGHSQTITPVCLNADQTLIISNQLTSINSETKSGKIDKIVTGNVLYNVVGDYQRVKLGSANKNVYNNFTTFTFAIPSDVTEIFVDSAYCTEVSTPDLRIGMSAELNLSTSWSADMGANLLSINFPTYSLVSNFAYALVSVKRF